MFSFFLNIFSDLLHYGTTTRVHLDYQASTGNVGIIIIIISSERREKKELYTICCCYYYCVEWILIVPGLHVHGGWCLERAWLEDGSWQATPEKRLSWTKSSVRCGSWRGSNG